MDAHLRGKHHPDVDLRARHVDVRLTCYDTKGVTDRDIRVARRISAVAADALPAVWFRRSGTRSRGSAGMRTSGWTRPRSSPPHRRRAGRRRVPGQRRDLVDF